MRRLLPRLKPQPKSTTDMRRDANGHWRPPLLRRTRQIVLRRSSMRITSAIECSVSNVSAGSTGRRHDPEKAKVAFEKAVRIAQFFIDTYPESELAATDMAACCYFLGDLLFDQVDPKRSLQQYEAGLKQVSREFGEGPNPHLVELRVHGWCRVARAHARLYILGPALDHYGKGVKLAREWARKDPGDVDRQWMFLLANDEAADFLGLLHAPQPALGCYENSLETCVSMVEAGYITDALLRHIQHCYQQMAIILEVLGDISASRIAADRAARFETQTQHAPAIS